MIKIGMAVNNPRSLLPTITFVTEEDASKHIQVDFNGTGKLFAQDNRLALLRERVDINDKIFQASDFVQENVTLTEDRRRAIAKGFRTMNVVVGIVEEMRGTPDIHLGHEVYMRKAGSLLLLLEGKSPSGQNAQVLHL